MSNKNSIQMILDNIREYIKKNKERKSNAGSNLEETDKDPKMLLVTTKSLVLFGTASMLWILLKALFPGNGVALICMAVSLLAIHWFRVPQLPQEKIPDNILSLFNFKGDNLKNNVIFHKGGASHAPENTVEAIKQAGAIGVKGVEIDLDFSKDDVGVVIHGPKVDDTTDGTGFVTDFNFCDLEKLNAAAKDPNIRKFPNCKIPTLEACIKECLRLNLIVFIDCKGERHRTANLIYELFQKHPELYGSAVVCSFYPTVIHAVRQKDYNIITAVTHRNHILTELGDGRQRNKEMWKRMVAPVADAILSWSHWAFIWYICGNSFFLVNKDQISKDSKNFWSSLGVHLVAWTVNEPSEQNFLLNTLKVPIITDGLVKGGPVKI